MTDPLSPLKKMPVAPESLKLAGALHWYSIGNSLIERGILFKTDLLALEMLCHVSDLIQDAPPQAVSPLIGQWRALAREFSLTPKSRPGFLRDWRSGEGGDFEL